MPKQTDAELVNMVRELGDTAAYGELIQRYQGHAYGLAYSILGDWAEAQDMAQEGFIRAYINLHTLDRPERFPAWLQRIVFSVCMMWLRSFRPELYQSMGEPNGIEDLDTMADTESTTPLEQTLSNEMSDVVLAAINELPQKYRIPLTMFHLDGLSYRKVADFLDIPLGTVQSLISRARKRLRPALESYAQEALPMVEEALDEHKLTYEFAERTIEAIPMRDSNGLTSGVLHCMEAPGEGIGDIFLSNPDLGLRRNLTRGRLRREGWSPPWEPCGSPHGQAVIMRQYQKKEESFQSRIHLLEMADMKLRQVPHLFGFLFSFSWSPDSSYVGFGCVSRGRQGESSHIIILDRATLTHRILVSWPGDAGPPSCSWSPTGEWIASTSAGGTLRLISPESGEQRILHPDISNAGHSSCWSPDGKRIAIAVEGRLSVVSLAGKALQQYDQAIEPYEWSKDGRLIYYEAGEMGNRRIRILSLADGESSQVDLEADSCGAFTSPTGERMVFYGNEGSSYLLLSVGDDGRPRSFGDSYHGSFMYPSWLCPE